MIAQAVVPITNKKTPNLSQTCEWSSGSGGVILL